METFNQILENPLYIFLFGSGGVLIIIITLISLRSKKDNRINIIIDINKEKQDGVSNINSDETKNKEYNLEFESKPIIDKTEEYDSLDFDTEEYYITFLKTIEEKKKAGDKFEFK